MNPRHCFSEHVAQIDLFIFSAYSHRALNEDWTMRKSSEQPEKSPEKPISGDI